MTFGRIAIAAGALVGIFYFATVLTSAPDEQTNPATAPAVQEPVRTFVEEFYACPDATNRGAMKARAVALQSTVAKKLPDPDYFCTEVLSGGSSSVSIAEMKTVFVQDSSAGVTSSVTVTSKDGSESIVVNVELAKTADGWKVSAVS